MRSIAHAAGCRGTRYTRIVCSLCCSAHTGAAKRRLRERALCGDAHRSCSGGARATTATPTCCLCHNIALGRGKWRTCWPRRTSTETLATQLPSRTVLVGDTFFGSHATAQRLAREGRSFTTMVRKDIAGVLQGGGGGGQETSDGRQAALRTAEMGEMPRRKKGPTRSRLCAAMAPVMGRSGGRYQHSDRVAGVRGQSVQLYRVTE